MRQQGSQLREIAKATESDLGTVKKWIASFEAKEKSGEEKTKGKR